MLREKRFYKQLSPIARKERLFPAQCKTICDKSLQCLNCMKPGHVRSVCEDRLVGSRYAEMHSEATCKAAVSKCSNFNGPHEASSKDYEKIRGKNDSCIEANGETPHIKMRGHRNRQLRHRRCRSSSEKCNASASVAPIRCPASASPFLPGLYLASMK